MSIAIVNLPYSTFFGLTYLDNLQQVGSLTYTGAAQSPQWNLTTQEVSFGGDTSGTGAGTYTITATPNDDYRWADTQDTSTKSKDWTIGKATPQLSASISGAVAANSTGTITLSGNICEGNVTATSANSNAVEIVSTTTNSVTVRCKAYSATPVTVTINVAGTSNTNAASCTCNVTTLMVAGGITLSETSGTVTYGTPKTFTVTSNTSGGALSVTSSDSRYVTESVSGNTVTVNVVEVNAATQTITVTSAANGSYGAASATYTVTSAKANGSVTLSANTGTVSQDTPATFEVTAISAAELSAQFRLIQALQRCLKAEIPSP